MQEKNKRNKTEEKKEMIGIIVAAGKAKRMRNVCKTLIKVNGKPIIEHIIRDMLPFVKKIIIIQHGKEIEKKIGIDYLNVPIQYVQQKHRRGIAHAIYQCKREREDMLIFLGDIIYNGDLSKMIASFEKSHVDFLFGVQKINNKDLIKKSYGICREDFLRVIEKPLDSDLDNLHPYLGLGIYMATPKLFEYIKKTKPNERTGEIEFTDTINVVPKDKVAAHLLEGFYTNINTEKDLEECKNGF